MSYNSKYTGAEVESYLDLIPQKVDKVEGKQLSAEDFTSALKTKLEGLSNYDDSAIQDAISGLQSQLNTLVSGDADTAIESFNEIIAFLEGVEDTETLDGIIASIEQQIADKYTKPSGGIPISDLESAVQSSLSKADTALQEHQSLDGYVKDADLATVATSGSYVDLSNKPTIPSAVTESTVSGWGFTKNTGTITGITMNGASKGTSGVVNLGTVITAHQDISGKQDKLVSGTNIKTINGESILGEGDLTIEGGAKIYEWFYYGDSESVTLSQEEYDNIVEADLVVVDFGGIISFTVNKSSKLFSEESGTYLLTGQFDFQGSKMYIQIEISIATKLATITYKEQDIPTKTSQLENDSNFVSSDGLKTINGESIVGSGDIVISGGSGGGSSAYPEVNHGTADTTFTLTPNVFHVWDEVASLTLTLGDETAGVANEFLFQFNSGTTATTLTLPDTLKWANDSVPTIEANKIYQISVLKGLASVLVFDNEKSIFPMYLTTVEGPTNYRDADELSIALADYILSNYVTDGSSYLCPIPSDSLFIDGHEVDSFSSYDNVTAFNWRFSDGYKYGYITPICNLITTGDGKGRMYRYDDD